MINYGDESYSEFKEADIEGILIDLLKYIDTDNQGSIAETILDFCYTRDYRIEEIGEIIKNNKLFKDILEQDCIHHRIFQTENTKLDEW